MDFQKYGVRSTISNIIPLPGFAVISKGPKTGNDGGM